MLINQLLTLSLTGLDIITPYQLRQIWELLEFGEFPRGPTVPVLMHKLGFYRIDKRRGAHQSRNPYWCVRNRSEAIYTRSGITYEEVERWVRRETVAYQKERNNARTVMGNNRAGSTRRELTRFDRQQLLIEQWRSEGIDPIQ